MIYEPQDSRYTYEYRTFPSGTGVHVSVHVKECSRSFSVGVIYEVYTDTPMWKATSPHNAIGVHTMEEIFKGFRRYCETCGLPDGTRD